MLEDICDKIQSHRNVNKKEARYKIRGSISQRQSKYKGALKDTQNLGKGLHKLFRTAIKEFSQELPPLEESCSEVSHFIPEPENFSEATKLSDDIKKPWLKATLNDIRNLINNKTFLIEDSGDTR